MGAVSTKLRNSARNQPCTFNTPFCNHDPATVVLCHIRDEAAGKATKANDYSSAFGCSSCHHAIDLHWLSKEDELFYSLRAMQRTLHIWVQSGIVFVPQDTHRPKPSSKIMDRRHIATGETIR
ncbi:MAG: DUF1364 domain-containing protein [Mesorhizobium sp.]|nr:MAG: DUF1364 domain-containing protein [Mesorhizobium sp.]